MTYKEVAKKSGNEKAYRAVANLMARNKDPNIPCHRVIRSDFLVGGYKGKRGLDWKKAALLLKEGAIGVIPTDTIYGICTSSFKKDSVEKIYKLRKRNPKKPFIILISDIKDLKKFKIKLSSKQKRIIKKLQGLKVSFILASSQNKLSYIDRGSKTLAFRIPMGGVIKKILEISGPIVAPSANFENQSPAKNIREAKRYFKNKVFYLDRGELISAPSTLIDLSKKEIKILRKGSDLKKLEKCIKIY